ncbi:MAG TPA: hypothetical protein PKM18_08170, partial [bacterium]|nr:hypothetical protein [bacterium]
MKKVLILTVFAIFMVSCKGSIVQLTATPDFGDGENNQTDSDLSDDLSDEDSSKSDDDSLIPDDDSPFTDHDSPVTDDDSPFTDHDSPVTDDDVITCTEGELRCSSEDFDVEECDGGKWVTKEECGEGWICDDSVDPIVCADQICFPGARYCKMGDVYSCASNGLSEEMTENCTDTQYCDEGDDPGECRDMVCTPTELYCDANVLRKCDNIGSGGSVEKDCNPDGVCDEGLEGCVYTSEIGGDQSYTANNARRGVFYNCTKNVTVIEFAQGFDLSTNTDLTWAIYEAEGNTTLYK